VGAKIQLNNNEKNEVNSLNWGWWLSAIIPALGRLRKEDNEFKASLGYMGSPRPTWVAYHETPSQLKKKKRRRSRRRSNNLLEVFPQKQKSMP
jgi:hypothetical protein